jgi:hypothetical protein
MKPFERPFFDSSFCSETALILCPSHLCDHGFFLFFFKTLSHLGSRKAHFSYPPQKKKSCSRFNRRQTVPLLQVEDPRCTLHDIDPFRKRCCAPSTTGSTIRTILLASTNKLSFLNIRHYLNCLPTLTRLKIKFIHSFFINLVIIVQSNTSSAEKFF